MDFDSIMKEVTGGLSGDNETDMTYLKEQMDKYKDHELGTEIIRACGRLFYELLPDDAKKDLAAALEKDDLGVEATLEEVRFNIYQKNFDKAEVLMSGLVKKVDELAEAGMFQNDAVSEYYTFLELFEEILFRELHQPQKDIRHSDIPYAEIYLQYGSLLVDLKQIEKANEVLKKAVRWNPTNAKIAFEYAETFKMLGELDTFFELSKDIFKFAYKPSDVARCYRNLAFYFVEKELWSEAIGCNLMSMQYDNEAKNAQSELYYIQHITGGKVTEPTLDELREIALKYGFSVGADKDVLGLAYAYGNHFLREKQYDVARYFLTILYSLTDDEDIKNMLDQIPE